MILSWKQELKFKTRKIACVKFVFMLTCPKKITKLKTMIAIQKNKKIKIKINKAGIKMRINLKKLITQRFFIKRLLKRLKLDLLQESQYLL